MSNIKTGDILNFNYTGAVQSITLPKGTYKLECWGAQGGNRSQDSASATVTGSGLGGYSIGTLTLTQLTTCYIYVGGQGGMSSSTGNVKVEGGFNGGGFASHESTGEPGNGGGGATDVRIAQDSLYARVIVAGGGGGSGEDDETGGYGGGETGGAGSGNTSLTQASQTSGGTNSFGFGLGGNTYNGGAGGGGWYGGASRYSVSSYSTGSDSEGGGGGSGYVYTSSTAKNYPSGCLLNSSYYLSNAQTIAGNNSFASPTGSSETGHSGNGYCRITVIECKNTALYTRINNSMKKATAFYFKLNNNKMYGIGSANSNGAVMNFDYTGSVQTTTLTPGRYKLECWGAEGGIGNGGTGGLGGYSKGELLVTQNLTLYMYIGSKGYSKVETVVFNGGGLAEASSNYNSGSGGGATDISLKKDSWDSTNHFYSRLIVAGGGGGGAGASGSGYNGAYGGGEVGGGVSISNSAHDTVSGGTQTTAGISSTTYTGLTGGSFGKGGTYQGGGGESGGGGGGGWYGGGAGSYGTAGAGGSGYVYTSTTASNYPSGCLLNSTYYLSNAQTIAGNQSFPSPTGSTETGHSGNGHVKITKLSDVIYLTQAKNDIMDFNYTGSVQSKTLKPGTYTLECWGGQGGTYSSYIGGYGGYSKGTITLAKTTTVYVSVGGAGSSSSTTAGFNGGGTGISSGRGGGGATDVRIGQNSLYSRVIVAGGGGGAGVTSANANPCGCGGGEYGGDGYYNNTTGSYTTGPNRSGGSASQTAGGITWNTGTQATFGQGGNASGYSCGGGGGGWYGGGGAYDSDSDSDGRWGGGGSGYVYTSSTAKNYPNGCLLNSTHYLTNAQTIAGDTSFTSPTGAAETGHTGNGFCRITNLNPTQYGLYVKTHSGWKHIDL